MLDVDFMTLVRAMFNHTDDWRQLDGQIRDMNKRLAIWRRGTSTGGITYAATQKAAFELMVTMQQMYGIMQRSTREATTLPMPTAPQPTTIALGLDAVILEPCGEEICTPRWLGWDHIHAGPDTPNVGVTLDVAAA